MLAEGGHPLADRSPAWHDELFFAEALARHHDFGRLLRLDLRVYLPACNAWLPADPWIAGYTEPPTTPMPC